MTPLQLASYVRQHTRTTSVTFPDSEILLEYSVVKDDIALEIQKADEDYFVVPQTRNLVANQREYSLPLDMMSKIKRVEVKFDGTNFVKLVPFDMNKHLYSTDEAVITNHYTNNVGECVFDLSRKSLYLFSGTIAAVTNGIKLWAYTYPEPLTSLTSTVDISEDPSSTTFGMPREFHELIARQIIIRWKQSRQRPIPLTENEMKYSYDLQQRINLIEPTALETENIGSLPKGSVDGQDGYNL